MELRNLTNDKLFPIYQADLILRIRNEKNLQNILNLLTRFKDYLGEFPPSPELAKGFLAQFTSLKAHTFYNYLGEIKRFMAWYGEELNVKAKIPKTLPTYHEDSEIEAILAVIKTKKSHKTWIARDTLLVELDWRTGLRRKELANLEPRDIHADFLIVRLGKGGKDRVIPLTPTIAKKLHDYIQGMDPNARIFGLNPTSLGMKIKDLAKRAGLQDFHCHSLRHKFATDLLEKNADLRTVQELMGHSNLNTTQLYLAVTDKRLREAVNLLDEKPARKTRDDAPAWVQALDKMANDGKNYIIHRDGSLEEA